MKLDLDEAEDRADDLVFNEIIWKAVKGEDSPMPPPVRSAFVLPSEVTEDRGTPRGGASLASGTAGWWGSPRRRSIRTGDRRPGPTGT